MTRRRGGSSAYLAQFWAAPYRPLFLAAILCALATVLWWPLGVIAGLPEPAFPFVSLWHAHEMFFGFAGAAMGGYLLTALPSWTGTDPLHGWPLKLLVALWVLARVTSASASQFPIPAVVLANSAYFLVLAGILCHGMLVAKTYRKLLFCFAVAAMACLDGTFLIGCLSGHVEYSYAVLHTMFLLFSLMILTIGGTAIPAFTRNWLLSQPGRIVDVVEDIHGRHAAAVFLIAAFFCHLTSRPQAEGIALLAASLALLISMRRWQSFYALANPLLAALHISYLLLPIGLAVIGWTQAFGLPATRTDALHIVTVGAMAGLVMAIAGRAASHRGADNLQAGRLFIIGISLIWLATFLRVSAFAFPSSDVPTAGAATAWGLGWLLFLCDFRRALQGAPPRPVLSSKRHDNRT